MLWRGAAEWPVYADGRSMVIAGGNVVKFVIYHIHFDPSRPDVRLTNWRIMARLADGTDPPPRREDWNRPGRFEEASIFARAKFRFGFVIQCALSRRPGRFMNILPTTAIFCLAGHSGA